MKIDHDITLTAAEGEFFHPGFLVCVGKDGKAYRHFNRPYPWWAKGRRLRRFWAARQPQVVGFALIPAKPGQYVIVGVAGSGSWPNY